MRTTHQQAREWLRNAFFDVFQRDPTLSEIQCAQAVAWIETQYGDGWGPNDTGHGSFNMGAVQAGSSWAGLTFEHRDSSPQSDGTSKWYTTKFRKYPTPQAGMVDLIRAVYQWHGRAMVLGAATAGDIYGFSVELHASGYYEGFGATVAARIANHHHAIVAAMRIFTHALNEPMPANVDVDEPAHSPWRTVMIGSRGIDVKALQVSLGVEDDGVFGPLTQAAVLAFQRAHGLKPDGVVGAQTWGALEPITAMDRRTLPET